MRRARATLGHVSAAGLPQEHSDMSASALKVCEELGLDVDVEGFHRDGYAVVRGFESAAGCEAMRNRMAELVEAWNPNETAVFRTDDKQEEEQGSSDLFLDSADKISFFLEAKAVDEATGGLRQGLSKHNSVNKCGHGLHCPDTGDPVFAGYANSVKVAALARSLGWKDPVLPQSMYIFKGPGVGGEVTSHQDSTFLFTEPRQTCLGLWLALEPATLNNGCVWGRPGSHREPVRRHFRRNPEYFDRDAAGEAAGAEPPQMVFKSCDPTGRPLEQSDAPWEGGLPAGKADLAEAVAAAGFKPLVVSAGDLVVLHGAVDHLSLANLSSASRHTFQLHLVEGQSQGVRWSPANWLQYPAGKDFPSLDAGFH